MSRLSAAVPPWLAHALRAQRGPVPWSAVVRGALAAGPLLLVAVLSGRTSVGVVAALGAMLAGINDRPGSRRAAVRRLGVPALAGAGGLLVGSYAGQHVGAVTLTLLLTVLGLLAGAVSAVGPVASGAGTQLLVAAAIGAGMPLPEPGWQRALFFVGGAGWLLVLRLALPTPGAIAGDYRFDGERDAVGACTTPSPRCSKRSGAGRARSPGRPHRRARPRPGRARRAPAAAVRQFRGRAAAARAVRRRAPARRGRHRARLGGRGGARKGRRRAAATRRGRTDQHAHRAAARARPLRTGPARPRRRTPARGRHLRPGWRRQRAAHAAPYRHVLARTVLGSAGREYGLRVALCFGAGVAVAQALHHARWYGSHAHWYWLPATAVFLVKPDLGPLASRVICRAAGTVLGAVLFAGFAALLPRPAGLVALVALCGALIPVATRHFAAQTAVVTVLVLSLVMVGGEPGPPGAGSAKRCWPARSCCSSGICRRSDSAGEGTGPPHARSRGRARLPRPRTGRRHDRRPGRSLDPAPRGLPRARRGPRLDRPRRRRTPRPGPARRGNGRGRGHPRTPRRHHDRVRRAARRQRAAHPEHTERITALLDELAEGGNARGWW